MALLSAVRRAVATPAFDDERLTRRARLLNAYSHYVVVSALLIAAGRALGAIAAGWPLVAVVVVTALGAVAATQLLMRSGQVRASAWVLVSAVGAIAIARLLQTGGIRGPALAQYANLVILVGLTLGIREMWCAFGLAGLTLVASIAVRRAGPFPALRFEMSDGALFVSLALALGVTALLIHYALRDLNRSLELARTRLAERERAETAQREAEALHRRAIAAVGAVPYAVDYDRDGYDFVGEGIRELMGCEPAAFTPPAWRASVLRCTMRGEAAGLSVEEATARALAGELEVWACDSLVRTMDGRTRWIGDTSVAVQADDGRVRGSIGILQDVTERQLAEVALEHRVAERTAQLEDANRELESFAYSVSHDLRAPLRAVEGFSQALLEDHAAALDAEGRDYLERIRSRAQRMDELISDLLRFSRLSRAAMHVAPVDLSALAAGVVADLREAHPGRDVEVVVAPDLRVEADEALMRVVLQNLLGNAWKFTARHATARIEFGTETGEGRAVWFVRDDGAGFDMAYAEKLFGVFQRLHDAREFPGTGIGLATVQRIVHRHGGRVWAEGAPERGATFRFTLGTAGGS